MKQIINHSGSRLCASCCESHLKRRGAIVLIPMLCLILALAVIGGLLKQTSIELKQLKKEQYLVQANWLANAAAQRAVIELENQKNYTGETWNLSPEQITGTLPGSVKIEIQPSEIKDQSVIIRTIASYPSDSVDQVRVIREWPAKPNAFSSSN